MGFCLENHAYRIFLSAWAMDTVNEILTTDKQSVDILYLDFLKGIWLSTSQTPTG